MTNGKRGGGWNMQACDTETDLCLVVQRLNRRVARAANQALKDLDLTIEQVTLLSVLGGRPSMRAGQLSEALGLDTSTISINTRPLLKRGLLHAVDDPRDGRARMLSLTVDGTDAPQIACATLAELQSGRCSTGEHLVAPPLLSRTLDRLLR